MSCGPSKDGFMCEKGSGHVGRHGCFLGYSQERAWYTGQASWLVVRLTSSPPAQAGSVPCMSQYDRGGQLLTCANPTTHAIHSADYPVSSGSTVWADSMAYTPPPSTPVGRSLMAAGMYGPPTPVERKVSVDWGYPSPAAKCDCGAAKLGAQNFSPAHSSWCSVSEAK